jgi:hypothetical protein
LVDLNITATKRLMVMLDEMLDLFQIAGIAA